MLKTSVFTAFLCAYKQKNRLDRRFLLCYARLKGHNALNTDILTYLPRVVNLSTKKKKGKTEQKARTNESKENIKTHQNKAGKATGRATVQNVHFGLPVSRVSPEAESCAILVVARLSAETVKGAGSCPRNLCAALPQRRRISEAIIQNVRFVRLRATTRSGWGRRERGGAEDAQFLLVCGGRGATPKAKPPSANANKTRGKPKTEAESHGAQAAPKVARRGPPSRPRPRSVAQGERRRKPSARIILFT